VSEKKIDIMGVPVTVVSDKKAEESDYLVCAPYGPSSFTDNLKGVCCRCGIDVMYRWHAPRKPKRICMECFVKEKP
jgi:hypothetical protein